MIDVKETTRVDYFFCPDRRP